MTLKTALKMTAAAASLAILAGCASTSALEEVRMTAESAQADAAEARSMASQALNTANQAQRDAQAIDCNFHCWPLKKHLKSGHCACVSHQHVGETQALRVESARYWDAHILITNTPEVLNRGVNTRCGDFEPAGHE